jgi:UDP-N-acetyl-D-mannosaminuronate dehydrogenase
VQFSAHKIIKDKIQKFGIIGLGCIGLPSAVSFAKKCQVVDFDIID